MKKIASPLLGLLLACGVASAQISPPPLPAAEAAAQIGRQVVLEDVVKAVSRSQSRKGYYLSFGRPYPEQVLSVWVADEVFFQMPTDPGLTGRKVRITGRVESSPTGPMMKLASTDDFALLEIDEAILAKEYLDGRMDREQFRVAVAQTFWREDFETLEELAQELRESRERVSDGTWLENNFYIAFETVATEADERFDQAGAKFERWLKLYPDSAPAVVALAGYHIDRGYHEAQSQTPEGWAALRRELRLARQVLEQHPAAQSVPEWFVKMQIIAYQERWPKKEFNQLFEQAIASEPDYYTFYFHAARYAMRLPGGWVKFAEEQRAQRKTEGEGGDALYARIAFSMSVNYRNIFRTSEVDWSIMAAGFDQLMALYPNSLWLKNSYAKFAFQARDRVRLRPALAAIEGQPDMGVWVNLENLALARKFLTEESEPPPGP